MKVASNGGRHHMFCANDPLSKIDSDGRIIPVLIKTFLDAKMLAHLSRGAIFLYYYNKCVKDAEKFAKDNCKKPDYSVCNSLLLDASEEGGYLAAWAFGRGMLARAGYNPFTQKPL
jgi:hypothetical protein